jgi:hypothetical protein
MTERVIGRRRFTDGEVRIVFEDVAGQCVLDDDGDLVRGVWIVPSEQEPTCPSWCHGRRPNDETD